MPDIFAADLDRVTVRDIEKWRMVNVIDKHNMTAERFQRLRRLVQERGQAAHSTPLNVEVLDEKLRNIGRNSRTPTPSTPGPDEIAERMRAEAYEEYDCLIRMGGRPSAPIQADPGAWNPAVSDERLHLHRHWLLQSMRTLEELDRWKAFRKYQHSKRRSNTEFEQYKATLHQHDEQKLIQWRPTLNLEPERQSKLDDWKEYYLYEHRKLNYLDRKLQKVKKLDEYSQWLNGTLRSAERAMKTHHELLEWIRGQLPLVAAETAIASEKRSRKPYKGRGSSKVMRPSDRNASTRKRLVSPSALKPVHASKVSKPVGRRKVAPGQQRGNGQHSVIPPTDSLRAKEEATMQPTIEKDGRSPKPREINRKSSPLRPTNSSKVSKKRISKPKSPKGRTGAQGPGTALKEAVSGANGEQRPALRRSARIRERMRKASNVANGRLGG